MIDPKELDDVALKWALRDVIAGRHVFLRVSEAKLQRLREIGWMEDRDGALGATEAGHRALR